MLKPMVGEKGLFVMRFGENFGIWREIVPFFYIKYTQNCMVQGNLTWFPGRNSFLSRTKTTAPWKENGLICFCVACLSRHIGITLSPVVCWCCLLWKGVNIWLYLPHGLMDFNQSWVIDATWEPSFVDVVKGHISRSKDIWGQVVR